MNIRPIEALAVIKTRNPKISANGIFHKADRAFIIVSDDELLIDVTITPIEKKLFTKEIKKPHTKTKKKTMGSVLKVHKAKR